MAGIGKLKEGSGDGVCYGEDCGETSAFQTVLLAPRSIPDQVGFNRLHPEAY